jgi:hypothetical protein
VYQPRLYQRLIDLQPSPRSALEFCVGTPAEMTEGDICEVVDHYSRQGKLAYVHLRNVHGKAPHYNGDKTSVRWRRPTVRTAARVSSQFMFPSPCILPSSLQKVGVSVLSTRCLTGFRVFK